MAGRAAKRAALLIVFAFGAASDAPGDEPASVRRIGASERICQLTGETDWLTGRPTAAKTLSAFGLDATDLGYPVEHQGKLFLLFGDSWPTRLAPGEAAEAPPNDAVGMVARRAPPSDDGKCLELQIQEKPGGTNTFAPATVTGPNKIDQGFFNVPSGGVSVGGDLYAFFWTHHCAEPQPLSPSPDEPLARPPANDKCREDDRRNSIGSSVLASSEDEARTFRLIAPAPIGFIYSIAVVAQDEDQVPDGQRRRIFIFGAPRYRASVTYLAEASPETFADPKSWRFFVGRNAEGQPQWASYRDWVGAPGAGRGWRPPGAPEIFADETGGESCIGEFSISWNRPLNAWLMLYNCRTEIEARLAPAPWGPWSWPTGILGPSDNVFCRLLMSPGGCGDRRDFWPDRRPAGQLVAGGFYAPFVLNRYTTATGDGKDRRATIYWLVSTWNPYEVAVMRTILGRATD